MCLFAFVIILLAYRQNFYKRSRVQLVPSAFADPGQFSRRRLKVAHTLRPTCAMSDCWMRWAELSYDVISSEKVRARSETRPDPACKVVVRLLTHCCSTMGITVVFCR